jgi:hypothetical protein
MSATEQECPNCHEGAYRESVDVGVGIIYGPWGCPCGWSEDDKYNQLLNGPTHSEGGYRTDQFGYLYKATVEESGPYRDQWTHPDAGPVTLANPWAGAPVLPIETVGETR